MTEEEIKKLQEDKKKAEDELASLKAKSEADIKAKDDELAKSKTRIAELEDISRKQSNNFKKLKDMSEKEKELLTEKEREILERQEKLEEDQKKFFESQEAEKKKNSESARDRFISLYAGSDPAKKEKILTQYNRFVDAEDNEEAIAKKVKDAATLSGFATSGDNDPVLLAVNKSGSSGVRDEGTSFAETEDGKGLAKALGINIEAPKPPAGAGQQ